MGGVAIVCDSTCDLGLDWFAANNVTMVPLKVLFGETTYLDWVDLSPEEFYEKLTTSGLLPKTSQPSPADFAKAYSALADAGYDEIVSIHLSAALSGTFESATMAAAESAIPVRVVDTRQITSATGLAVTAATDARDGGGDGAKIEAAAIHAAREGRLLFTLGSLEYLVKGGRAGKASGIAGALLNIKPVLQVNADGIIEPFTKVKGLRKAMIATAEQVAKDSSTGTVTVAFCHTCSVELVDQLRQELETAGADYETEGIYRIGAVMGTYAGPGSVGCAYYRKP